MEKLELVWRITADGQESGTTRQNNKDVDLKEKSLARVLAQLKLEKWRLSSYGQATVMGNLCLDFFFERYPQRTEESYLRSLES